MLGSEALFAAALGLFATWHFADIRFTPERGEIRFRRRLPRTSFELLGLRCSRSSYP